MHFASKMGADAKIDYILSGCALLSMQQLIRRQLIADVSPTTCLTARIEFSNRWKTDKFCI